MVIVHICWNMSRYLEREFLVQAANIYFELLCVHSSVMVAVPTTTTGDALSPHRLDGAAGREFGLLSAIIS